VEIFTSNEDDLSELVLTHVPVSFKAVGPAIDSGEINGYAATWEPDFGGDRIMPGAFDDSLALHAGAKTAPAFLLNHDPEKPIGRWVGMGPDTKGLRVKGALNLATDLGRAAHEHLKAGDMTGLSIGFSTPRGGATPGPGGTRLLHKVHLHEVSVVAVPMQHQARVISVKSIASPRDLEALLREVGMSKSTARRVVRGGWPALSGEDYDDADFHKIIKAIDEHTLELRTLKGKFK
jgi:HK97 family phage prohead protease